MLKSLHVKGFKSLTDLRVEFPQLTVLFGPNAAGKSNLLEAVQMLSRIGTTPARCPTPLPGRFAVTRWKPSLSPRAACPSYSRSPRPISRWRRTWNALVRRTVTGSGPDPTQIRQFDGAGRIPVRNSGKQGRPQVARVIEPVGEQLHLRRKSKPAHPRQETLGLNHALLSDPRWGGEDYRGIAACRNEFEGWRIYYLDPRVAMPMARPPADVEDIGVLGQDIAPYLYRLWPRNRSTFGRSVRAVFLGPARRRRERRSR